MAEVLVTFTEPTKSSNGDLYYGRVLGRLAHDGLWEGWLEFILAGSDETVLTQRETEQPNRADLKYWAQGLSEIYLEGALERALNPVPVQAPVPAQPVFADSAPRPTGQPQPGVGRRVVLDPFLAYAEGEGVLRSQLGALSREQLQNIVEGYGFNGTQERDWARLAAPDALVARIVERVRARFDATAPETEPAVGDDQQSARAERPRA